MDIIISNVSGKPIYEQISTQMKAQIMAGKLQAGEGLPSIRLLARELRISVITTKRAYEELERDGFIEIIPGKGSFVAETDKVFLQEEHLRMAEEHLQKAVELAKGSDIQLQELQDILSVLYKGD